MTKKHKIEINTHDETGKAQDQESTPIQDAPGVQEPLLEDPRDIEIRDLKEQVKRLYADFENSRRRMDDEYNRRKKFAETDMLREFLEVMDNLERGMESADKGANAGSLREGLELVLRQMRDLLEKHGVKVIEAKGKEFDPNYHEAVMREKSDEDEGIILEEMRRGYCMDDQVIRPCMVKVAYKG